MELEKVRSTDGLRVGDTLLVKQGQLKRGMKVVRIEGRIVHCVGEMGEPYEYDLDEPHRRWALYTNPPNLDRVATPASKRRELELEQRIAELEAIIAGRASPELGVDFSADYRKMVHHYRHMARDPQRVFNAHMSGGYLRVSPMEFKTWCRHNKLDPEQFSKWLAAKGFLILDNRGAHPKSNVSRTRMLRLVPV